MVNSSRVAGIVAWKQSKARNCRWKSWWNYQLSVLLKQFILMRFSKMRTLAFLNVRYLLLGLKIMPSVGKVRQRHMACAWTQQRRGEHLRGFGTLGFSMSRRKKKTRKQLLSAPWPKLFFRQAVSHLGWTLVPLMLLLLLNYCPGGLHWDNKAEHSLFTERTCMLQLSSLVQIRADLGMGK